LNQDPHSFFFIFQSEKMELMSKFVKHMNLTFDFVLLALQIYSWGPVPFVYFLFWNPTRVYASGALPSVFNTKN